MAKVGSVYVELTTKVNRIRPALEKSKIKIREREFQKFLDDTIGGDLVKRGRRVQRKGKQLVGKKTRTLQKKIEVSPARRMNQPGGYKVRVGVLDETGKGYGYWHHQGTRPHRIPKSGNKLLVFKVGRKKVFVMNVQHPGTDPNPFLRDALPAAGG